MMMKGEGWSTEYVSGVGGVWLLNVGRRDIDVLRLGWEGIIPTPRTKMFHVEHFAITLYIIRYEFTPPDQFIPYI